MGAACDWAAALAIRLTLSLEQQQRLLFDWAGLYGLYGALLNRQYPAGVEQPGVLQHAVLPSPLLVVANQLFAAAGREIRCSF